MGITEINRIMMGRTCCMTLKCGVRHKIKYSELVHVCLGCSNVTSYPLHTANSKTESHFKQHKLIDRATALCMDYFNKAASNSLDM
jgi:hypothetical protein